MARPQRGPSLRTWRHPAFATALAVLSLLVFSWPLARVPPLSLGEAFVHLFGAWVAVILVLWRMSSALVAEPRDGERDE